eukprot:2410234-Alexandrium_andersonii.AAC.1
MAHFRECKFELPRARRGLARSASLHPAPWRLEFALAGDISSDDLPTSSEVGRLTSFLKLSA